MDILWEAMFAVFTSSESLKCSISLLLVADIIEETHFLHFYLIHLKICSSQLLFLQIYPLHDKK